MQRERTFLISDYTERHLADFPGWKGLKRRANAGVC